MLAATEPVYVYEDVLSTMVRIPFAWRPKPLGCAATECRTAVLHNGFRGSAVDARKRGNRSAVVPGRLSMKRSGSSLGGAPFLSGL